MSIKEIEALGQDRVNHLDRGNKLVDFEITAAIISALDLVISVDTSVAHLAGALGRPVWALIPYPSDWRWMHGRNDSIWYPTMRLFRRDMENSWEDVIDQIIVALDQWQHDRLALPS